VLLLLLLLGVGLPGGAGSVVLLASYPLVGKAAVVVHHMVVAAIIQKIDMVCEDKRSRRPADERV
jgi:hypothetical protein